MVILHRLHTSCGTRTRAIPLKLLLFVLVLNRAVRGRVRLTVAKVTEDSGTIDKKLLRAVLKLMPLLTTRFTPDATQSQVIIDDDFELFCLVCLVQDCVNHRAALL